MKNEEMALLFSEATPYIQKYHGKTMVIKYGLRRLHHFRRSRNIIAKRIICREAANIILVWQEGRI